MSEIIIGGTVIELSWASDEAPEVEWGTPPWRRAKSPFEKLDEIFANEFKKAEEEDTTIDIEHEDVTHPRLEEGGEA